MKALNVYIMLIVFLSLFQGIHSGLWGIIEDTKQAAEEVVDDAEKTFNSVADETSGAVSTVNQIFIDISETSTEIIQPAVEVIDSIDTVPTLAIEAIEDIVNGFNVTTWGKLVDDAKYVIINLHQDIQHHIATGCNYLSELADVEFLPHPLDVMEEDDFEAFTDCITDNVYDLAVGWTKEVATTFASVVSAGDFSALMDFQPLLNTEPVEKELNDTYNCLHRLAKQISKRETSQSNIYDNIDALSDYFSIDDLTITMQISFTACTLSCGTASLGFAVSSTDFNLRRPYYQIAIGLDTSNVVGASVSSSIGFYKNFNAVIGTSHIMGMEIELPLLADLILDDTTKRMSDMKLVLSAESETEGEFRGFSLESDLIEFSFGHDGAFNLGYNYVESKWVFTSQDLSKLWNVAGAVVENAAENAAQDVVADAYTALTTNTLKKGGFFVKAYDSAKCQCPSAVSEDNTGNTQIADLSALQLGIMDIYEVVYGNIEVDKDCNSTTAYNAVRDMCQYGKQCSVSVNAEILGNINCDDANRRRLWGVLDFDDLVTLADTASTMNFSNPLTVIYGCPDQVDVFNLGCFGVEFLKVVHEEWFQDYNHDILDDGWVYRDNGLAKCAKIARENGYRGFGIYNYGMCVMTQDLFEEGVYNEIGVVSDTTSCPVNGVGSDVAMNLYAFANGDIAYADLGCINDTQIAVYNAEYHTNLHHEFDSYELQHYLFQDAWQSRGNAVSKCAQFAAEHGYKGFAMTDGGKCLLSNKFRFDVINKIRKLTNVDNSTTLSCSKGLIYSYNVFEFPYIDLNQRSEANGLSAVEISAIVIVPVIVIGLVVLGFLWFKKHKKSAGGSNVRKQKKKAKTKSVQSESEGGGSVKKRVQSFEDVMSETN